MHLSVLCVLTVFIIATLQWRAGCLVTLAPSWTSRFFSGHDCSSIWLSSFLYLSAISSQSWASKGSFSHIILVWFGFLLLMFYFVFWFFFLRGPLIENTKDVRIVNNTDLVSPPLEPCVWHVWNYFRIRCPWAVLEMILEGKLLNKIVTSLLSWPDGSVVRTLSTKPDKPRTSGRKEPTPVLHT